MQVLRPEGIYEMDNHETRTPERKLNGTLRFTDGRVTGDRRMQTQGSVERAPKQPGRFEKASGPQNL